MRVIRASASNITLDKLAEMAYRVVEYDVLVVPSDPPSAQPTPVFNIEEQLQQLTVFKPFTCPAVIARSHFA